MNDAKFRKIQSMFYEGKGISLLDIVHDKIKFENIKKTDIKLLNKWIKDHSDIYKMEKVILYHGTSAKHDIENEGILKTSLKSKRSLQSETGYTYLSIYPESAKSFASMGYPNEEIKIYAVEVLVKDLLPDHDQLKNKRLWSEGKLEIGKTIADSLVYGSGARLKRNIEPYEVRDITEIIESNDFEPQGRSKTSSEPSLSSSLNNGLDFS